MHAAHSSKKVMIFVSFNYGSDVQLTNKRAQLPVSALVWEINKFVVTIPKEILEHKRKVEITFLLVGGLKH